MNKEENMQDIPAEIRPFLTRRRVLQAGAIVGIASVKATRAAISFLFIVPILLNIDRLSIGYSLSRLSNLALYHLPASRSVGGFIP